MIMEPGYFNFQLGEDTIGPGLAEDLQKFYDKAENEHDRAKCLEILSNIHTGGNTLKGRPYTALPSYYGKRVSQTSNISTFISKSLNIAPWKNGLNTDNVVNQIEQFYVSHLIRLIRLPNQISTNHSDKCHSMYKYRFLSN